jgi:FkbM family methyltransferase
MLPKINIRSHSADQFLLDKILYSNSYRINNFLPDSTIVDIDANFGAFSMNACMRGAAQIYSFEPFQHNYEILVKNLSQFAKKYSSYQLGVAEKSGFQKISLPKLINNAFFDTETQEFSEDGINCYFCNLDEILKMIPEKIHLVKIGNKNAIRILLNSESLFLCENLCFELSDSDIGQESTGKIVDKIKEKGSFSSGEAIKNSQNTVLFRFSKTDMNICFTKYTS